MPEVKETPAVDYEKISVEELRALAAQQLAGTVEAPTDQSVVQPRDQRGRFTAANDDDHFDPPEPEAGAEVPVVEDEVEEEEEDTNGFVVREEIDLGDGAGIQVFSGEGDTEIEAQRDFSRKLITAQKNATKKIREQAVELKKFQTTTPRQVSDDEEFVYSQELMTKPTQAFKKLFKETTGMDIETFKQESSRIAEFNKAQAEAAAGETFLTTHPSFVKNAQNGNRMEKAIRLLQAEAIQTGRSVGLSQLMEEAFKDLSESGLLQLKNPEDATATDAPTRADQPRIEAPEQVVPTQRRKSSSLSSRQRTVAAPVKTTPSNDEAYSMPLDKLRELANKALSGQD